MQLAQRVGGGDVVLEEHRFSDLDLDLLGRKGWPLRVHFMMVANDIAALELHR